MAEVLFDDVATEKAFAEIERLAREIDPSLPADLSDYELHITMSKDVMAVEAVRASFARSLASGLVPNEHQ